ncbi:hypothetical protein G6F54_013950 [Rhizopus delemar]|nr:hypothetical protein G6F54_013950 [Rhizopus delemar]
MGGRAAQARIVAHRLAIDHHGFLQEQVRRQRLRVVLFGAGQHGARQLVGQLAIRARLDDAQSPRPDLKSARRNAGRKASASSLPPVWRTALSSSMAAS